jgi:hypothetical protein
MSADWDIHPAEPTLPARREFALYGRFGCISPDLRRHHTGNVAYDRIVMGWGLTYLGEPSAEPLALPIAAHDGWPQSGPTYSSDASHAAPRRRPDGARAPSAALRHAPIGRAAVA